MAVEEENQILAEAKELYAQLVANKKDSGNGALASLNKAILDDVSKTVHDPVQDVMSTVTDSVTSSREVATSVGGLPDICQKELDGIPEKLKLDALTGDIPKTVKSVVETMKAAVADPTILYPRLMCGSIPIDPIKIGGTVKSVTEATESTTQTATRAAPESSADVISGISNTFSGVADPLVNGLESLRSIREKLGSTTETVREIGGGSSDIDELVEKQSEIGGIVDKVTSLFSSESPVGISERGLDGEENCMGVVEEGTQLVRSAGEFQGPIARCVEKVKAMGERLSGLVETLKGLFKSAMDALKNVVELIKEFVKNIPTILEQIKLFFVPSGLRSLLMVSSNETQNLLSSVEKLRTAVPEPEEVESNARSVLGESQSASLADAIKEKIQGIVEKPMQLVQKLAELSTELPGKVIGTAMAAVKKWAKDFGMDIVGDKMEESIANVAGMIGGEQFANAVEDFLPFGDNDGDSKIDAGDLADKAGDMFKSLF